MIDPYLVLGVRLGASAEEVKRAWLRKLHEVHPDMGGDSDQFKEVTAAYELLKGQGRLSVVRQTRQSRPQLVCILADNSGSMAQEKARAATEGNREMIMECQSRGPGGPDRSYFKLLLIRFGEEAVIDPLCDMTPIRMIDPDRVEIDGRGGDTDITGALELLSIRLIPYMQRLQHHPERAEHPLPLVLLFSDGEHNLGSGPQPVAAKIKSLSLDGDPVVIAVAGVSVGESKPDEKTLRQIASPDCYVHITNAQSLTNFISSIGSSGVSRAKDVAHGIKLLQR